MSDPTRYDDNRICEIALALLSLTLHDCARAWKDMSWDVMNLLFERGWLEDPRNQNKSVVLTEEGLRLATEFADKYFRAEP